MVSKLQQLLASKKQEAVNVKPVLQPQAEQIQPESKANGAETAPPERRELSILERLRKPSVPNVPTGEKVNTVVEQGLVGGLGQVEPAAPVMPEGLSKLQQIQWKKANANANNSNTKPNAPANSVEPVGKTPEIPNIPPKESTELSASQAADKAKTNDGVANIAELKSNLEYLAANIENGPIVKDIVRTIAMQVARHPEICKHMTRGEVNTMVRGLRSAYQVAAMNKKEKVESKKKGDAGVDEITQAFKSMGINFKF